jgi:hypothetical protein
LSVRSLKRQDFRFTCKSANAISRRPGHWPCIADCPVPLGTSCGKEPVYQSSLFSNEFFTEQDNRQLLY